MRVLIVDDEPKAIALIASYLEHFSGFDLVNTFRNALKALEYLNSHSVDVIFLDINMPHLSGLSLAKMIPHKTAIVFTTAYSEHALESYEVDAMDYLLKPISLERFSKTMTKLINKTELLSSTPHQSQKLSNTIFVKSGLETHQIDTSKVKYLKKDGNYIHYVLSERSIMARQSISEALSFLTEDFIQVQKSFIVNFRKIQSLTNEHVVIDKERIPIGLQFKVELLKKVGR